MIGEFSNGFAVPGRQHLGCRLRPRLKRLSEAQIERGGFCGPPRKNDVSDEAATLAYRHRVLPSRSCRLKLMIARFNYAVSAAWSRCRSSATLRQPTY